jgi:acylphosphatase
MPETVRLHAWIHGFVQGVSFRYYTIRQAQSLAVVGWVRNRWDGSVEVVAEGPRDAVNGLLSWLHRGPPAAEVDRVDVHWEQPTDEFSRFEVRF